MKTVITLLIAILIFAGYSLNAQVAVTTDGSSADGSAMLDVKSSDKGMLIPRVALTGTSDITTISSPVESLMVYNTATAGDVTPGFYYWNGTAWTPMAGSSSGSSHYVGELYGGGVVFWVDHTGQHGLILSMVDLSPGYEWSNVSTLIGTTNDWDGASNTTEITMQLGHSISAAKLCEDYTNIDYGTGTYSDWYLPSLAELNHVWNNFYEVQKALTNDGNTNTTPLFRSQNYWSSSEHNFTNAWYFNFSNGVADYFDKSNKFFYVRAVRAF